jgi:glucose/arabinose dehydrogenase
MGIRRERSALIAAGATVLLNASIATASITLLVANNDGASATNGRVHRYDGYTGAFIDIFLAPTPAETIRGLALGPDGMLYASTTRSVTNEAGRILRYNAKTAAFVDEFVTFGGSGVHFPVGMEFNGAGFHVVNNLPGPGTDETLRFNPSMGNAGVVFATGIFVPQDLTFGPDGNLYVSSGVSDAVYRYNGSTGAFMDIFVSPGSGGLDGASALTFGPDHNLYVASLFANAVFRYDGATGAFIDQFVTSGDGGLSVPDGMAFGPDGNLYVNTRTDEVIPGGVAGAILRFSGNSGEFIDEFVPAGSGGLGLPQNGLIFIGQAVPEASALMCWLGILLTVLLACQMTHSPGTR